MRQFKITCVLFPFLAFNACSKAGASKKTIFKVSKVTNIEKHRQDEILKQFEKNRAEKELALWLSEKMSPSQH